MQLLVEVAGMRLLSEQWGRRRRRKPLEIVDESPELNSSDMSFSRSNKLGQSLADQENPLYTLPLMFVTQ